MNIKTDAIHLSSAWINVSVKPQVVWSQVSWCLKMFKHWNSGGHKAAERILATTENKVMEQMSARNRKLEITWTQHTAHFSHCILSCEATAPVCWQAGARWLAGVEWSRNWSSASDRCLSCSSHSAHCDIYETATVWRHRKTGEENISFHWRINDCE